MYSTLTHDADMSCCPAKDYTHVASNQTAVPIGNFVSVGSESENRQPCRGRLFLPAKRTSDEASREVREVPCVDGSVLARTFCPSQVWSEQPCVQISPCSSTPKPLMSAHLAGHAHVWTWHKADIGSGTRGCLLLGVKQTLAKGRVDVRF